jgi:CRISPR/Cas system-associated protein Cas10 (large subunit of type III CRISPR-Cas system)
MLATTSSNDDLKRFGATLKDALNSSHKYSDDPVLMDVGGLQKGEKGKKGDQRCAICGRKGHGKAQCWHGGKDDCRYCGKPGHFERECRKKKADEKR